MCIFVCHKYFEKYSDKLLIIELIQSDLSQLSCAQSCWVADGYAWVHVTYTLQRSRGLTTVNGTLHTSYSVPQNYVPNTLGTRWPVSSKPCTPSSKPCTLYPQNHAFLPGIWPEKIGIPHQCWKIMGKPMTFQHEKYVLTFNTQVKTWW